ncbi:hypothetical protein IWX90DRAFT_498665 [Phyllosticta citrichinensis]|uniref:HECT-type E3 ubiquitin transferase n=1 Tax=Phyllosticta citrichinensis TaxID=1130410 RepID=A0ABR1Y4H5_9PEZI
MPSWGSKQHSRSASHPFPSLFSSKRRNGPNLNPDCSSPEEDKYLAFSGYGDSPAWKGPGPKVQEDVRTCMTCDSKVKYPAGLRTFRCSACLMINDLVAVRKETSTGKPHNPAPLSVPRTRHIIDRCIVSYLHAKLEMQARSSQESSSSTELNGVNGGPPQPPTGPREYLPPPPTLVPKPTQRPRTSGGPLPKRPPPPPGQLRLHHSPVRRVGPRPPERAPPLTPAEAAEKRRQDVIKSIFRHLQDYLIDSFGTFETLNSAFLIGRQRPQPRTRSESAVPKLPIDSRPISTIPPGADFLTESDPKMLMLGDIGENGAWWAGHAEHDPPKQQLPVRGKSVGDAKELVSHRSPLINWDELRHWYDAVLQAGVSWKQKLDEIPDLDFPESLCQEADDEIREARMLVQRTLLKVSELILKRPHRPLREPEDVRFLLIILENPLLHGNSFGGAKPRRASLRPPPENRPRQGSNPNQLPLHVPPSPGKPPVDASTSTSSRDQGQHAGVIKRIFGLLANMDNDCHRYVTTWFSRFSEDHFRRTVDLVGRFVTYRLTRQQGRKRSNSGNPTAGLIPEFDSHGATSAQLHAALGLSGSGSKPKDDSKDTPYSDDWQLKAAAKVMALLFAANNTYHNRKTEPFVHTAHASTVHSAGLAAKERARAHGQLLPTSDFYNTLLDYHDLVADFEAWESRRAKFSFCQYPFFLSIGAKIRIMEHDARRQMENKAREAFFDSILSNKNLEQYFSLKVRRECLADDSLRRISEVVGAGSEDIKKGLRVQFIGEEGVDAGGLRKEWFLLLVRELFDPMHAMFVYDEESHFCYFNPYSFEKSDQFFLVGAVLGLALYNSTILDVALPPFAFKKLLSSAPTKNGAVPASRNTIHYTLEDLAEFRPSLAKGLRQLLEFDGDVENTFCRDFVAEVEYCGAVRQEPLCPNGANIPVTNANRQEFVDLYVRYLLDTAVARQFDPFRRGFFTICGGNALSLFRSEEIELLVRGSDEPLDVASLRLVASYDGWKDSPYSPSQPNGTAATNGHHPSPSLQKRKPAPVLPPQSCPPITWFWDFFSSQPPVSQRRILSFITGSDRIPAVGATNLVIKIVYAGEDCDRFPVARTCFNALLLYRYRSREKLERMLWRAVVESEGFGLK